DSPRGSPASTGSSPASSPRPWFYSVRSGRFLTRLAAGLGWDLQAGRILWPLINATQVLLAAIWTAGWITVALIISALRGSPAPGLIRARRVWGPGTLRLAGARLQVEGRGRLDPSQAYFFA